MKTLRSSASRSSLLLALLLAVVVPGPLRSASPSSSARLPLVEELDEAALKERLRPGTRPLDFVFTSDVHGQIRPEGRLGGQASLDGLLRWRRRARLDRESVLFLDGGDLFQGTPEANLDAGETMIAMGNALGLDVYTLGNHDFDYGRKALEARLREVRFPVLGANLRLRATGRLPEGVRPWTVLRRRGLRIAVIGLCSDDEGTYERQALSDFAFLDPVTSAREAVAELKAQGGWDLLVALTHLGLDRSVPLAAAVPEIDLVFDGHSHQLTVKPLRAPSGALVMQAGAKAAHAGLLELVMDGADGRPLMARWALTPLLARPFAPGPAVSSLVDAAARRSDAIMDRPVAPLPFPVPSENWGVHNPLGALVTDAFLRWGRERLAALPDGAALPGGERLVAVDVAVIINGGIRASLDTTPAGCTLRQLFSVLPFENRVCLRAIRGRHLRALVESGLRGEHLPKARQKWVVQAAGLSYRCDPRRPEGSRLTEILVEGRPLEDERLYGIVLDSFLAEGGGGMVDAEHLLVPRGVDMGPLNRDALAAYLKTRGASLRLADLRRPRLVNALFP